MNLKISLIQVKFQKLPGSMTQFDEPVGVNYL